MGCHLYSLYKERGYTIYAYTIKQVCSLNWILICPSFYVVKFSSHLVFWLSFILRRTKQDNILKDRPFLTGSFMYTVLEVGQICTKIGHSCLSFSCHEVFIHSKNCWFLWTLAYLNDIQCLVLPLFCSNCAYSGYLHCSLGNS